MGSEGLKKKRNALKTHAEVDVGCEHGSCDGGESSGHDSVQLGSGHHRKERPDEKGSLRLQTHSICIRNFIKSI